MKNHPITIETKFKKRNLKREKELRDKIYVLLKLYGDVSIVVLHNMEINLNEKIYIAMPGKDSNWIMESCDLINSKSWK